MPNHSKLISEQLEKTWSKLPYKDYDKLPLGSGVYIVVLGDEILYVGLSKNIWKRHITHDKWYAFRILNTTIYYALVAESSMSEVEQQWIKAANPALNGLGDRDDIAKFIDDRIKVC